ncbi:unnamed protein product, partial [Didymodactylos carnosus]
MGNRTVRPLNDIDVQALSRVTLLQPHVIQQLYEAFIQEGII